MKPMNIMNKLNESVNGDNTCVLCGKQIKGWGNDAWPLADGYCCDKCNNEKVIPARIAQAYRSNEDNLKEENRYGKTEDNDPVLDKTIKVYDINDFVDKEINTEEGRNYKAFNYPNGAAIIVTSEGNGAILDYEAVGVSFNSTSDTIYLNLCEKDTDDGNGNMSVAIMPSARVKVTIDDLLKSPSKEMKARDFFKKYNYNDRCDRNFDEIKHYLTEGDKYSYITYANNPEKIGAEYEYNSMANTEVIEMLYELKTYFTQAEQDAKEIIATATFDPGVSDSDVEMCKFCAEKAQEMIDKMNSTWE